MYVSLLVAALSLSTAAAPSAVQPCSGIIHEEITVDGRNDEWTSAEVKVNPHDLVIVFAKGSVKIGSFLGATGPAGNADAVGRLEMKVGTGTVTAVGTRWVGAFDQTGTVKFKVRDSNYTDNAGEYKVKLIIIPAGAFPPAVEIASES